MQLHFHFSLACIGEGNGNPLQCSCLENPRDGGVWWEAVCGVAQSQTRLKRLSSSSSIRSSLILALFPVKANATGIAVWPCGKFISPSLTPGFPVVKNLPANAGDARDGAPFLGPEDPLNWKWQLTPVFLPGEFHGRRSLEGCSP